ncbi:MAG TPA: S8 family serine peptidase [Pyrinomonadaceae bacterium]|nr:S8 family serine peptidase [Pyrinomonadaceae bacterium]
MNRQNFLGHLALALMLVLVAAFVGQVRRWESRRPAPTGVFKQRRVGPPPGTTPTTAGRREPEVLVRFRDGVSPERVRALTAGRNDQVEDEVEAVANLYSVDDRDDADAELVAAEYSSLPEVLYAEPNGRVEVGPLPSFSLYRELITGVEGGPNDPLFPQQWALVNKGQREGKDDADISAVAAWAKTRGSDEVVVAVLDSGVDYSHPDLVENMWVRPDHLDPYFDDELGAFDDFNGYSAVAASRDPMDENGHGTHVAGIVGARGNNGLGVTGVNWNVRIMPLKFMGRGGFGTTKDAIEAINYAVGRRKAGVNVRVINASWGSRTKSKALEDAIAAAGREGILFVAASGNDGADADRRPHYPSSYDLPNVLSVAAMNRRDELASFSNYGARSVHLAAPGAEILSTWLGDSFEEHSGTSMATPVVAGVAALVLSVEPDLGVKELRSRLLETSDRLDVLKGKVSSGGRVNAARAVGASR